MGLIQVEDEKVCTALVKIMAAYNEIFVNGNLKKQLGL